MKKTPLPVCPYRVSNGNRPRYVIVKIRVPSRVAAMLEESTGGFFGIPSAGIVDAKMIQNRKANWKTGKIYGKRRDPGSLTGPQRLESAIGEGCDTKIRVWISSQEWQLVNTLCTELGITPGQWYVACAHYNASVQEAIIDTALAAVADREGRGE